MSFFPGSDPSAPWGYCSPQRQLRPEQCEEINGNLTRLGFSVATDGTVTPCPGRAQAAAVAGTADDRRVAEAYRRRCSDTEEAEAITARFVTVDRLRDLGISRVTAEFGDDAAVRSGGISSLELYQGDDPIDRDALGDDTCYDLSWHVVDWLFSEIGVLMNEEELGGRSYGTLIADLNASRLWLDAYSRDHQPFENWIRIVLPGPFR